MAAGKKTTAKVEALNEAVDTKAAASEQAEAIEKKENVKSEAASKKAAKGEAAASKKTAKSGAAAVKKTVEKKAAEAKKAVEEKVDDVKKTVGRKPGSGRKAAAKKGELQSSVILQLSGNEYTQDGLVKIARDVWEHDLNQKADDLVNIELYVKPEEHAVYYVMNEEFKGSFYI